MKTFPPPNSYKLTLTLNLPAISLMQQDWLAVRSSKAPKIISTSRPGISTLAHPITSVTREAPSSTFDTSTFQSEFEWEITPLSQLWRSALFYSQLRRMETYVTLSSQTFSMLLI